MLPRIEYSEWKFIESGLSTLLCATIESVFHNLIALQSTTFQVQFNSIIHFITTILSGIRPL